MAVTQQHVSGATSMGANLVGSGATFRVWAPRAVAVHIVGNFSGSDTWQPTESNMLVLDNRGTWTGFVDGARDGDHYKFYVVGEAGSSYKRDPYARELSSRPAYPNCNCVIRDPQSYRWRATNWRTPPIGELVIYQFHVGTFAGPDPTARVGTFLDALDRLDHWVSLGINAIEPLPVVEFSSPRSMGYDGSDLFSPEMDYTLEDEEVDPYLPRVNGALARHGAPPMTRDELAVPINQLKAFVDLCHLNGIAVILDVVYNHAGHQIGGQQESLWFFDWAHGPDKNQSLYFTDREHTGPVFALWKEEVRQFLIDNVGFFLNEYRVDGLRFDQVSVIVTENAGSGWRFCQDCTSTMRARHPHAFSIAEHWPVDADVPKPAHEGGAGFDAAWTDGIRSSVREAIAAAGGGQSAHVDMQRIADALWMHGFGGKWRGVQYVESHDEVYRDRGLRIARLADKSNARSWYARSRARVATALVLASPGIPMLFVGQEFLEDKQWSDNPTAHDGLLPYWAGLDAGDRHMSDHARFVSDLVALRRTTPALRGEGLRIIVVDNFHRLLAFQRWVEGLGGDVVIVASLNEQTLQGYRIGLPWAGTWREAFNSDLFDHFPNPAVAGNAGSLTATHKPWHGLSASAELVVPANGVVVLVRDVVNA